MNVEDVSIEEELAKQQMDFPAVRLHCTCTTK